MLFKKARKWLETWREKRKLSKEASPRAIRNLATEIIDLSEIVLRVGSNDRNLASKLAKIKKEMNHLQDLTGQKGFRNLPFKQRLELKEHLAASRQNLVETLGSAPTASKFIQ